MGSKVLIVDDESDIRLLTRTLLEQAGHRVLEAADGLAALRVLYAERPDLVMLDVGMPVLDGWEALARIRDMSDVPVIMLTARGDELERVRGLRAGADDYVGKPFGRQELLARVDAVLRRSRPTAETLETYDDGFLSIDFGARRVTASGQRIELTPLEFKLLTVFSRNPDRVLEREQILDLVWGDAGRHSVEQVKLYVGYLRAKFRDAGAGEPPIETVRGFGYLYRRPAPGDGAEPSSGL